MIEPLTYTLAGIAKIAGFALRTLQRGCRANRIEHFKKGRARVISQGQTDALLASCRRTAAESVDESVDNRDRRRALARLERGSTRHVPPDDRINSATKAKGRG